LKVSLVSHEKRQGTALLIDELSHSWLGEVKLAIAIGIAYFLAARLGLALRVEMGVVFFWPAAGIAVGALIALGPKARLPVVAAVIISMVASILMAGRSPWLAIALGLATAGEALLTAWLIKRWFNGAFKLEEVPQVLGFLVASAIAAAIGTAGAAIAIRFVEPTTFPPDVWRLWFASCSIGIITVAPVLIGLGQALREPPSRRELTEGAAILVILAGLGIFFVLRPLAPWATDLPVLFAVPILLWVAARCRPVFAAAAMCVVTLTVALSTTFNLGHSGDTDIMLVDRIRAAQTLALAVALLALILAALFSERRRSEAALKEGKERLRLALDGAGLGAFSADLTTGRLECDARAAQLHGHNVAPGTIKESRRFVCSDDLVRIAAALAEAKRSSGRWNAEYRVLPPPDHIHAGETRWVAVESSIVRDCQGNPVGLLGVARDITERKQAEDALAEVGVQRVLAARAGLVGTYVHSVDEDTCDEKAQISPGYAAIHGLPEGTNEITRSAWLAHAHPQDAERLQMLRDQAFRRRQREYSVDYRIVRDGEVRWIESRTFISYNSDGSAHRVIGVNIDVTERRRTEQALTDRNRQLELAAKHALVGQYVIEIDAGLEDFSLQRLQFSSGFAAIYGLPEETTEISLGRWRSLVHPDDLPQFLSHRQQLFAERRCDHHSEHRIVRPCGTIRWIEARSFIEYDQAGHAKRMVGVNIDITERKRAEEARKILNAELDHRVKNALATVIAVISHTRQGSRSVVDFAAALERRIRSMAATHDLLSSRHWQELSLIELIRSVLAPYAASKNTEISGPTVLLKPEVGQALSMVLHELATNAAKYGALSTSGGRVLIRWDRRLNGRPLPNLILEWREVGGPRVDAPGKSSYGTSVINDLIPYEFGGTVDLVFAPEGVMCRLKLPSDWLTNAGEPTGAVADTAQ
jgi:PAS domain S-box-containing protein